MRVGTIGMGQAGGRIADLLYRHSLYGDHGNISPVNLAINAARADLMGLRTIPKRDRILLGQTEVRGHGVGLVRQMGAKVTKDGLHNVMHIMADRVTEYVDAYLIVVGLGGGTGSGGAPIVAAEIKDSYHEPVFVLGILPSDEEGKLMASNAVECLYELLKIVDGIILFDNNLWRREDLPLEQTYKIMNYWLIKPLPLLLGAGEATRDRVGIKVVDAGDIINSWKGISVLGYSELKVRTWVDKLLPFLKRRRSSIDELSPTLRTSTLLKNAAASGLSCKCNLSEAQKGLMLLAGPRNEINIEGYSLARKWLEDSIATEQVRGGDYPLDGDSMLHGVLVLSGFDDLARLKDLREVAAKGVPKPKM